MTEVESIGGLKSDMARMFGVSVKVLGDPFGHNGVPRMPEPVEYKCSEHGWWYPSDNICCPGCRIGRK